MKTGSIEPAHNVTDRMRPEPGQKFYICLSDLSEALKPFATDDAITVLDYGCGDSPYRPMYPNATYQRADLEDIPDVDFIVRSGKPLEAPDESVDLIFSSQVIEHVYHTSAFFADCYRLLKPGGRLLVTTHGSFIDHSVPYDYQRWTPWGLRRDLEAAGFQIDEISRMTTGPRAALQFWEYVMEQAPAPLSSPVGWIIRFLRGTTRRFRPQLHRWADAHWNRFRLCQEDEFHHRHSLYVGLLGSAHKPN